MENIAPRVGIKPISLAFWASMLTIPPPKLLDASTLSLPTCVCGSLLEVSANYYTCIPTVQTPIVCTHTVQDFSSHTHIYIAFAATYRASVDGLRRLDGVRMLRVLPCQMVEERLSLLAGSL